MRFASLLLVCSLLSSTAWAAGSTTPTVGGVSQPPVSPGGAAGTVTAPVVEGRGGFTVFNPALGTTGYGMVGPYGYQPSMGVNSYGAYEGGNGQGSTGTAVPAASGTQASAPYTQSVYGKCYNDDKGQSVHQLISWECHADDGTIVSAGECQTPNSITPCSNQ